MPSAVRGSIAALPTIGVVQATLGRGNIFVGKLFSRRYMCLPNDCLKFSVRHLFKVFLLSNILVLEPRWHHRCTNFEIVGALNPYFLDNLAAVGIEVIGEGLAGKPHLSLFLDSFGLQ